MFLSYPTLHQLQNLFLIKYEMLKLLRIEGLEESEKKRLIAWLPELQVRNGMFPHPRTSVYL